VVQNRPASSGLVCWTVNYKGIELSVCLFCLPACLFVCLSVKDVMLFSLLHISSL